MINRKPENAVNVFPVFGNVKVTNTLEEFKSIDVKQFLDTEGQKVMIKSINRSNLNHLNLLDSRRYNG